VTVNFIQMVFWSNDTPVLPWYVWDV
jgi:hypothetical protein